MAASWEACICDEEQNAAFTSRRACLLQEGCSAALSGSDFDSRLPDEHPPSNRGKLPDMVLALIAFEGCALLQELGFAHKECV